MTRTTTLWSLLLLSAALALGSCTKDATEQATGPEPEAKAASKLVFSSENAVRGELLVCFGEEAVAGIESSVMQVTRSGGVATRSGIADFDAVLGSIGVKALQRLFPVDERNEERTRAAGLHRWYVVEFDAAADLDKAALDMARIAEVSKVEFNQQLMHVHEGRVIPLAETGAAPQTRAAVGFNDPTWADNGTTSTPATSRSIRRSRREPMSTATRLGSSARATRALSSRSWTTACSGTIPTWPPTCGPTPPS